MSTTATIQRSTVPLITPENQKASNGSNGSRFPFDEDYPEEEQNHPLATTAKVPIKKKNSKIAVKTIIAGIDAGSRTTAVFYLDDNGEPDYCLSDLSCVAVMTSHNPVLDKAGKDTGKTEEVQNPIAFGRKALDMQGRRQGIEIIWPVEDGMSRGQTKLVSAMMQNALKSVCGCKEGFAGDSVNLQLIFGVPYGHQTASYIEDLKIIGLQTLLATKIYIAVQPVLSFIGSGAKITKDGGNICGDGGGSTFGVAALSGLDVVDKCVSNVEVGGGDIDRAIADYIDMNYSLPISERYAEQIKILMGSEQYASCDIDLPILSAEEKMSEQYAHELIEVQCHVKGKTRTEHISIRELDWVTDPIRRQWMTAIYDVLTGIPSELDKIAVEMAEMGLIVCGDGTRVRGFQKSVEQYGLGKCVMVENPGKCVIRGMAKAAQDPEILKRISVHSFEAPVKKWFWQKFWQN